MQLFYILTLALFLAAPAKAEAPHMDEDAVQHYKGSSVASKAEAIALLHTKLKEIQKITTEKDLKGTDLELIHEISYTLENGIDYLIANKDFPAAATDKVDEAVQAIHFASENHEEEIVREWAPKLALALGEMEKPQESTTQGKDGVYEIIIKDHKFLPDEIHIPAGKKIKLVVDNQDPTPEEFESDDFRREKIISGNSKATIFVGPLKPGKYHFYGEFNLDTANGYLYAE